MMTDLEVIEKAARGFYFNELNGVTISDAEYDELLVKTGLTKYDVFKLIGMNIDPHYQQVTLPKSKFISSSDLPNPGSTRFMTPKYDGSSITLRYHHGILYDILSADSGISQYEKLKKLVPQNVDPIIQDIYCEAVIHLDHGFDDNSRSKANGLINSKHKQDEVDKYITIIAFAMKLVDTTDSYLDILKSLPTIRLGFSHSPTDVKFRPAHFEFELSTEMNKLDNSYLIDGVVYYDLDGSNGEIWKIYYNSVKTTKVRNIILQYTDKDSYSVKANFDTVRIEGSNISNASLGGASRMFAQKIGIGSEISVIKSGATIPIIKEVITPSEECLDNLKCKCGTIMTIHDVVGLNIRCSNTECSQRKSLFENRLKHHAPTKEVFLEKCSNDPLFIIKLLNIDRFNLKKVNPNISLVDFSNLPTDKDEFSKLFRELCWLSSNQLRIFNTSIMALHSAIQNLYQND